MKFQNETSSWNNYGSARKLPYAFTEQGVAMLSAVLKSEVASKGSINIMRAFMIMRKYILNSLLEQKYINNLIHLAMNSSLKNRYGMHILCY